MSILHAVRPYSTEPADFVSDNEPDTIATPEGDNEFAPDQPLKPIDEGHQKPPAIDTNNL